MPSDHTSDEGDAGSVASISEDDLLAAQGEGWVRR